MQIIIGLIIIALIIYFVVNYWVGFLLIALAGLLGYKAYKKGLASRAGKWLAGGAAFFILAFFGWLGSDGSTSSVSAGNTTTQESAKTNAVTSGSTSPTASGTAATTAQSTAATTQQSPVAPARIQAKVTEVIDGDTFKAVVNGKEVTIRMLLIDTPETKHPTKGEQPFGKEASNFTKQLIGGKTVELEQDVTNGPDKYGRLLYYVYVDGKSVQEQLLEKGLARVAYVFVPNVKYVDKYREIQAKAQKAGVGIWSIENYAQEDGYHPEVVKKSTSTKSTMTVQKKQTQPQHQEPAVDPNMQQVFYRNCSEARAAGAAPLYEGEPGYRPQLDRDHDGVACE